MNDKDLDKLLRELATRPGWSVKHAASGVRVDPPEGRPVWVHRTISDVRGKRNIRAALRKIGA